jgi:hypothetical protein
VSVRRHLRALDLSGRCGRGSGVPGAAELMATRPDTDARRASLYAALGFCQLAPTPDMPELAAFKAWMSTWRGIGDVVVGLERQGFAVALRSLVDGIRGASPARAGGPSERGDALRGGAAGRMAGAQPSADGVTRRWPGASRSTFCD